MSSGIDITYLIAWLSSSSIDVCGNRNLCIMVEKAPKKKNFNLLSDFCLQFCDK